jgi:hypothetical protein
VNSQICEPEEIWECSIVSLHNYQGSCFGKGKDTTSVRVMEDVMSASVTGRWERMQNKEKKYFWDHKFFFKKTKSSIA